MEKIETKFKRFKQLINEGVLKNKDREILFVDEHGKNVVYDNGSYRIVVDDPDNARFITLWNNTDDKWVNVGVLDAKKSKHTYKDKKGNFLSINSIEIDKPHRGLGYGKKMFKTLVDFSGNDVQGIYSYLPNRRNKKQIPNIYKKFDSEYDGGDYEYILFEK